MKSRFGVFLTLLILGSAPTAPAHARWGWMPWATQHRRPPLIGVGTPAYEHALREAKIIAGHGLNYAYWPDGGHPLGTAPGCRNSGTGYTWDRERPGHCWENELPESRIVARARWQGESGAWFWSAHYR